MYSIMLVVVEIKATDSSVAALANDMILAPCLIVKTAAASHSHSHRVPHLLLMARNETVLIVAYHSRR